jgi:hypothetical protein
MAGELQQEGGEPGAGCTTEREVRDLHGLNANVHGRQGANDEETCGGLHVAPKPEAGVCMRRRQGLRAHLLRDTHTTSVRHATSGRHAADAV